MSKKKSAFYIIAYTHKLYTFIYSNVDKNTKIMITFKFYLKMKTSDITYYPEQNGTELSSLYVRDWLIRCPRITLSILTNL